MLFNTKFDLVFSLGAACSCTEILRKCRLQFYSYPFDWLFGSDIVTRTNILANNFKEFIDIGDLEDINSTNNDEKNLCEIFRNKRNGINFNHDFEYGKLLSETYKDVREKYDRRAQRLINNIENSKNVLAVYIETPDSKTIVSDTELYDTYEILKNRFFNQKITLLYLYCEHNKNINPPIMLKEGIYKTGFDYNGYDKKLTYVVNGKILQKLFCRIKITNKYVTLKNNFKRQIYLLKCLFRGML